MIKSPIVTGSEFNGYPLLPYEGPNAGYYSGILKIIQDRMEDALARTSQVLIVRLVVKLPSIVNGHDNSCFQYFIEEYRRAIGAKLLHYVWVREKHGSHNAHWHLLLDYDANKMRYLKNLLQLNRFWQMALEKHYAFYGNARGLIHMCDAGIGGIQMDHGVVVHRDNQAMIDEILKICSYLAKINTKGSAPKNVREYGSSQLRK